MSLYLIFQIIISWITAWFIIMLFYKTISASDNEIYLDPALLTLLVKVLGIDFPLKAKFIASSILHHTIGICFVAIYYLIWYYEFTEISWKTSFIIGIVTGLLRIVSWTFLVIIIPSARLAGFKGYYLQLVFLHNIFTITALILYKLIC